MFLECPKCGTEIKSEWNFCPICGENLTVSTFVTNSAMKLLRTLKIKDAIIHVWQDDDGSIILGGLGWYEYSDYENLKKEKR